MPQKTPNDDLLAELNGGGMPPLAPGDKPNEPDVSREDILEAKIPDTPTARESADAKHSTAAGGKGYAVKVQGDYYAPATEDPRRKMKKVYEVEVCLPSLDRALSMLKGKVLPAVLAKKFKDFISLRTLKIVDVRPLSPATPESRNVQFMTREALERHIQDIAAPINVAEYPDVVDLRDAVTDFLLNPNGFKDREARRQADRAETRELAAMNPEMGASA